MPLLLSSPLAETNLTLSQVHDADVALGHIAEESMGVPVFFFSKVAFVFGKRHAEHRSVNVDPE